MKSQDKEAEKPCVYCNHPTVGKHYWPCIKGV